MSARLRLVRSLDPRALLEGAADVFLEPFARPTGVDRSDGIADSSALSDPFASPRVLLVLRQGGLRDDLIALAAERSVRGWFDPPICLFQQLPEWLGSTDRKPCGDYERVVVLAKLFRDNAPAIFARVAGPDAFVDAVDRLFGELISAGVSPAAFEAACAGRADRDDFEFARDSDLIRCYAGYCTSLEQKGRRDGRDHLVDCARAVAADPAGLETRLGGRREIRIVGLQDLRGGWPVLLRALRTSPVIDEIVLYSVNALERMPGLDVDSVVWLGDRRGLAGRLSEGAEDSDAGCSPQTMAASNDAGRSDASNARTEPAQPLLELLSAPDADREVEEVAQRIRGLLEAGTKPERIAIVTRSARPTVDRALAALGRYRVPASARQRVAFAEIPLVRSVLSLFAVAAEGWTRHGLVELAEQPYFGRMAGEAATSRRLDATVLNHIGYRRRTTGLDEWIRAHESLLDLATEFETRREAGEVEDLPARDTPPRASRVRDALEAFRGFAELAAQLDRPRPVRDWVLWVKDFLASDPWQIERRVFRVPDGRHDLVRIDAAGLRGMREILSQWNAALDEWEGGEKVMDAAGFEGLLREMLSGDAALWTPARRGVQVVEALAAAQRCFDHVFIVGLSGDRFPLRAPRSPILDEDSRQHLVRAGIPLETRALWQSRERDLFHVLVAGAASSLTLSWPRVDNEGRELATSVFVEDVALAAVHAPAIAMTCTELPSSNVASPSLPLIAGEEQRSLALHSARIERIRASGRPSPWNGQIEDPLLLDWLANERLGEETHTWSATQLEAYAKCPWAWFSQRLLRLEDLDDPDIDMDPLVRGTILHDALRRFYDAAGARGRGPVWLETADLAWARPMLMDALARAIDQAGSTEWLGAPALRATKRAELERMLIAYLEWEAELTHAQLSGHWSKKRILRTAVEAHERTFGAMAGAGGEDEVLELGGVRFKMRGSMDRVEIGIDDRIADPATYIAAVDYKTSVYSTPGSGKKAAWDDGVVLQVPLYAGILERRHPGKRVSRVEYRAIKQRETVHSLELYQIHGADRLTEGTEDRERMDRSLEAAGRHVERARGGTFPANPAPSCKCPPFCHAWDVCRVVGGPRTAW
ncbi:MAG: PD-(D/E)XK nuclease family protein [Longimicrobiales bacterium]